MVLHERHRVGKPFILSRSGLNLVLRAGALLWRAVLPGAGLLLASSAALAMGPTRNVREGPVVFPVLPQLHQQRRTLVVEGHVRRARRRNRLRRCASMFQQVRQKTRERVVLGCTRAPPSSREGGDRY
jgi:hypothetical protein